MIIDHDDLRHGHIDKEDYHAEFYNEKAFITLKGGYRNFFLDVSHPQFRQSHNAAL